MIRKISYFMFAFLSLNIFYGKIFYYLRAFFLKRCGSKIEQNVCIRPGSVFWPQRAMHGLSIGKGTFANFNFRVEMSSAKVSIGENCQIGANVSIECVSHGLSFDETRGRGTACKDVEIGNRVWIGANCVVLGGVEIGDGAVIGAGSVVTKNVDGNSLYLGVPARKVKSLSVSAV